MISVIASANINPASAPYQDAVVDLAAVSLGSVPDVQLYCAASDSGNPSATFTYAWSIVGAPAGSGAILVDDEAQNPLVRGIDTWGNLLLHVVATNTATSHNSLQQDPDDADLELSRYALPWSQFVVVRVKSAVDDLERPAPGERNTTAALHAHMARIAALAAPTLAVSDLTDVSVATGEDLDKLVNGSTTDGLHKHVGADLAAASVATRGAVLLSDAPVDGASPKALNNDLVVFTAHVEVTQREQGPELLLLPHSNGRQFHAAFHIREALTLTGWAVALRDGGNHEPDDPYVFRLLKGSAAALAGGTLTDFASALTLSGQPDTAHAPLSLSSATLSVALDANSFLAVAVEDGDALAPGGGLTITIWCKRRV